MNWEFRKEPIGSLQGGLKPLWGLFNFCLHKHSSRSPAQRRASAGADVMTDQEFSEILALGYERRGCKKLSGRDGSRIRLGDFRVVYEIDDAKQIVTILHIGHRRDVYH